VSVVGVFALKTSEIDGFIPFFEWDVSFDIIVWLSPMFVERKVGYSGLLTNLVRWHASAVSFPLSGVILSQLACSLSDVVFCLHSGIINLSLQTLVVTRNWPILLNKI
jgi:hypothetical protein